MNSVLLTTRAIARASAPRGPRDRHRSWTTVPQSCCVRVRTGTTPICRQDSAYICRIWWATCSFAGITGSGSSANKGCRDITESSKHGLDQCIPWNHLCSLFFIYVNFVQDISPRIYWWQISKASLGRHPNIEPNQESIPNKPRTFKHTKIFTISVNST